MKKRKLPPHIAAPRPTKAEEDAAYKRFCHCGHNGLEHSQFIGEGANRVYCPRPVGCGNCIHLTCSCTQFSENVNHAADQERQRREEARRIWDEARRREAEQQRPKRKKADFSDLF